MKLKGILVDVEKGKTEKVEIENKINEFYRLLKCRTIECPMRFLSDQKVVIICDEEGMFNGKPSFPPAVIGIKKTNGKILEQIFGNVFICKFNGVDDFASLSEEEIDRIMECQKTCYGYVPKYGAVLFKAFITEF